MIGYPYIILKDFYAPKNVEESTIPQNSAQPLHLTELRFHKDLIWAYHYCTKTLIAMTLLFKRLSKFLPLNSGRTRKHPDNYFLVEKLKA